MWMLILLLSLIGCDYFKKDIPPTRRALTIIERKLEATVKHYCEWNRKRYENDGYVHSRCDGVGFTSLYSLSCSNIDLDVFEEDGKLYRSPKHDCYVSESKTDNGAKSESSRDMYLMRLIAAFEHNDIAYLDRVIQYGESVDWVMCKGIDLEATSRCYITIELQRLHYNARKKLKGETLPTYIEANNTLFPLHKGYQAHLEVIKIWLSGRIYGFISDYQFDRLKAYAKRENLNALYQAIYNRYHKGNMRLAIDNLSRFPRNELPSGKDYCTEYLFQRDQDIYHWIPCDTDAGRKKVYSGTDFAFAVYVITH